MGLGPIKQLWTVYTKFQLSFIIDKHDESKQKNNNSVLSWQNAMT